MTHVLHQLERVIPTRASILITGETGTGKELVAHAIHQRSPRAGKPFIAVNCAALPESLLESELFGHRRGAFTGAIADKRGLFEIADGGTLFLDEVGEIPLAMQGKLLRALQEHKVRPVGAESEIAFDVRVVAATNKDLYAEIERGTFRRDLYYRLAVFPIKLPPLRERREDIPALAEHFVRRYAAEYRTELPELPRCVLNALSSYAWPGNVRELENEIQRLVIRADSGRPIDIRDLSAALRTRGAPVARKGTLRQMVAEIERGIIADALREHRGNKTRTAATLGLTREGLHKKLVKLGCAIGAAA